MPKLNERPDWNGSVQEARQLARRIPPSIWAEVGAQEDRVGLRPLSATYLRDLARFIIGDKLRRGETIDESGGEES